jgi:hypothetical protein
MAVKKSSMTATYASILAKHNEQTRLVPEHQNLGLTAVAKLIMQEAERQRQEKERQEKERQEKERQRLEAEERQKAGKLEEERAKIEEEIIEKEINVISLLRNSTYLRSIVRDNEDAYEKTYKEITAIHKNATLKLHPDKVRSDLVDNANEATSFIVNLKQALRKFSSCKRSCSEEPDYEACLENYNYNWPNMIEYGSCYVGCNNNTNGNKTQIKNCIQDCLNDVMVLTGSRRQQNITYFRKKMRLYLQSF